MWPASLNLDDALVTVYSGGWLAEDLLPGDLPGVRAGMEAELRMPGDGTMDDTVVFDDTMVVVEPRVPGREKAVPGRDAVPGRGGLAGRCKAPRLTCLGS